ncbi:MAG: hypothetical protein PHQ40_19410, partial [Anaerolineaceae bacterium]|nr:hypothetical protein [Anaerolineaceae bacterium]
MPRFMTEAQLLVSQGGVLVRPGFQRLHVLFRDPQAHPRSLGLIGLGYLGLAFFTWDAALKRGDPRIIAALAYLNPMTSTLVLVLLGGRSHLHLGVGIGHAFDRQRRHPGIARAIGRSSLAWPAALPNLLRQDGKVNSGACVQEGQDEE